MQKHIGQPARPTWTPPAFLAAVREHAAFMAEGIRMFGPEAERVVDNIANGRSGMLPVGFPEMLTYTLADLASWRVFERHREMIITHPRHTDLLVESAQDGDTLIPGRFLLEQPYTNPLFLFPQGIPCLASDGQDARIIAIATSGAVAGYSEDLGNTGTMVDTDDPRANGFHATVIAEIINADGTVTDNDWCHLTFSLTRHQSVLAYVEQAMRHFRFNGDTGEPDQLHRASYLMRCASLAVTHMLYAAVQGADFGPERKTGTSAPPKRRGGRTQASAAKSAAWREMGFQMGAAVEAQATRQQQDRAAAEAAGQRYVRPHRRRPHWHTYRTGPARDTPVLKFLSEIRVNGYDPATDPHVTGHRMGFPSAPASTL